MRKSRKTRKGGAFNDSNTNFLPNGKKPRSEPSSKNGRTIRFMDRRLRQMNKESIPPNRESNKDRKTVNKFYSSIRSGKTIKKGSNNNHSNNTRSMSSGTLSRSSSKGSNNSYLNTSKHEKNMRPQNWNKLKLRSNPIRRESTTPKNLKLTPFPNQ